MEAYAWIRDGFSACLFIAFAISTVGIPAHACDAVPCKADVSRPAPPYPLASRLIVTYVERQIVRPPTSDNEDPIPTDEGARGIDLGLRDSNATGRFVGVQMTETSVVLRPDEDLRTRILATIRATGSRIFIVNAPAADLLALADMRETKDSAILNISATDTRLRDADCRGNVLHVAPSRAMLTDALVQYLVWKKWKRILLVSGPHDVDRLYADSLRSSAQKFGANIVGEATFDAHGADLRDSSNQEFSLVTRGAEHDVVAVADEADEFGRRLVYNTDLPRPVVGTHGLTPASWGAPVEAWAAAQLQYRFRKLAGRAMRPIDYAGWMAVHTVGEAAVQLKSTEADALRNLMFAPNFEIGGFKGRLLSYRAWDGELRAPIFLMWPGSVVATAPMEGFLHPVTDLDSLGIDAPQSRCHLSRERS